MRETGQVYTGQEDWMVCEFDSLKDFCDYILNTPTNNAFKGKRSLASTMPDRRKKKWSGTDTFDEAYRLLLNGWSIGAQTLNEKLNIAHMDMQQQVTYKDVLSVCGYQAIVPLYLQGVPTNMVSKQIVPVKRKVITLNKVIAVSASVSSKTMEEESIKCFQIIKKIESTGIRVNLNLMISTGHVCVKIRLKSAGERLNISKLAFPLVHPSMFRRMYLRFVETYPTIPRSYTKGYGRVPKEEEFKKCCSKNEILLPTLLRGSKESEIHKLSVDELLDRLQH